MGNRRRESDLTRATEAIHDSKFPQNEPFRFPYYLFLSQTYRLTA